MGKEKTRVYWIKNGETFAGRGVGEEITDFFFSEDGECIQPARLEKLGKAGNVSPDKPINPEVAGEQELNQLRKTVEDLTTENAELKEDKSKQPKNITSAKKEIKELKEQLLEKEIEIENFTKPGK